MRRSTRTVRTGFCFFACVFAFAHSAAAQPSVSGFVQFGSTSFAASESFKAVLGNDKGLVWGAGGQVGIWKGVFVQVDYSQFKDTGERVFVYEGQVFPLGIHTEVTISPLLLTAGYRFAAGTRVFPYLGGGAGWYSYKETFDFADGDDVSERFTGYHVLGGLEVGLARWLRAAAEVQWATVPDALGADGVSAEFGESDLGGVTVRGKILIGRW